MSVTDLKLGSRWLLPVTYEKPGINSQFFLTDTAYHVLFNQPEIDTLIPADRITELEADVARLRRSIAQIHDMLMAPSPLDEYMLRQLVLFTYLNKENPNVVRGT